MSLNPLAQVTDYPTMLNRIFLFTTLFATTATWILRTHSEVINGLLSWLDIPIDTDYVKNVRLLGYLLPGLLIGLIARTIRLHDRISDVFGIRLRFDVDHILVPLAEGSGFPVGTLSMDTLRTSRSRVIGPVFYRYVSSTAPVIDRHFIYEALDWWSWYWVLLEGVAVFMPCGAFLLWIGAYKPGAIILAVCLVVLFLIMPFYRRHCAKRSQAEVDEILRDPIRQAEIRSAFVALQN
jgi:hypothetical protein